MVRANPGQPVVLLIMQLRIYVPLSRCWRSYGPLVCACRQRRPIHSHHPGNPPRRMDGSTYSSSPLTGWLRPLDIATRINPPGLWPSVVTSFWMKWTTSHGTWILPLRQLFCRWAFLIWPVGLSQPHRVASTIFRSLMSVCLWNKDRPLFHYFFLFLLVERREGFAFGGPWTYLFFPWIYCWKK